MCKYCSLAFLLSSVLLLTACKIDPAQAVRIDAYNPAGESETSGVPDDVNAHDGMIIAFEAGDEIDLVFTSVYSDLVKPAGDGSLTVVKPFYVLMSPYGLRISEDPIDIDGTRHYGSVSMTIAANSSTQTNQLQVDLSSRSTNKK